MFLSGYGCNTIAGELNIMGYRLPGGRPFYSSVVQGFIKTGIIYTGRSCYFKVSEGKFYQYKDGVPIAVDNLRGKAIRVKNNIDEWSISDDIMFQPIIPQRCLAQPTILMVSKSRRTNVGRINTAVYAGFLYCENCGRRMTADSDRYRCTTYLNRAVQSLAALQILYGPALLTRPVNDWLDELGIVLNWTGEPAPVKALYQIGEINQRLLRLKPLIENYLADQLSQVFEFTVNRDGSKNFDINGHQVHSAWL